MVLVAVGSGLLTAGPYCRGVRVRVSMAFAVGLVMFMGMDAIALSFSRDRCLTIRVYVGLAKICWSTLSDHLRQAGREKKEC